MIARSPNWVDGPGLALGHPISFDCIVGISSNANEHDLVTPTQSC